MRWNIRGKRLWPPAPSTNEAVHPGNGCGEPMENDRAAGAAVSGSDPHTLIEGFSAFTALLRHLLSLSSANSADSA